MDWRTRQEEGIHTWYLKPSKLLMTDKVIHPRGEPLTAISLTQYNSQFNPRNILIFTNSILFTIALIKEAYFCIKELHKNSQLGIIQRTSTSWSPNLYIYSIPQRSGNITKTWLKNFKNQKTRVSAERLCLLFRTRKLPSWDCKDVVV